VVSSSTVPHSPRVSRTIRTGSSISGPLAFSSRVSFESNASMRSVSIVRSTAGASNVRLTVPEWTSAWTSSVVTSSLRRWLTHHTGMRALSIRLRNVIELVPRSSATPSRPPVAIGMSFIRTS